MELTKFHAMLIIAMVVTGTMNTLVADYPSKSTTDSKKKDGTVDEVRGAKGIKYKKNGQGDEDNYPHKFNHPLIMTSAMFLGETANLVVYKISKRVGAPSESPMNHQRPPMYAYLASASCDMMSTLTFYIAMSLGATSMAQMVRAASIIFTGLASKWILKRKMYPSHWVGMAIVCIGVTLCGWSSKIDSFTGDAPKLAADAPKNYEFLGVMLVVGGQLFTAGQMVIQEKILSKYDVPPMKVVGYEGVMGFIAVCVLILIASFIPTTGTSLYDKFSATGQLENVADAAAQMWSNPSIIIAFIGLVTSIAVFNYVGMTITKHLSATHRMVLDTIRSISIWIFTVLFGWETLVATSGKFYCKLLGFVFLVLGTMVYNNLMTISGVAYPTAENEAPGDDETPKEIEMSKLDVAGEAPTVDAQV
eukprot:979502_1